MRWCHWWYGTTATSELCVQNHCVVPALWADWVTDVCNVHVPCTRNGPDPGRERVECVAGVQTSLCQVFPRRDPSLKLWLDCTWWGVKWEKQWRLSYIHTMYEKGSPILLYYSVGMCLVERHLYKAMAWWGRVAGSFPRRLLTCARYPFTAGWTERGFFQPWWNEMSLISQSQISIPGPHAPKASTLPLGYGASPTM